MAKGIAGRVRERLRGLRQRLRGVPPHPEWVQVEINNTCNLNCVMCPREAMTRANRHMTMQEFSDIADKVRAAEVPRIRLFVLGEPLLHRELVPMIQYAKEIGIPSVEINTNAVLLDSECSEQLIAAGLDEIVFSLDGADAETYESIRVGANYEQVTSNIRGFFETREQMGVQRPTGVVQTMLMQPVMDQMQQFVDTWSEVADEVRVQSVREYQGVEGLSVTPVFADDELRPCPALWTYLAILADLRVVPCCVDINGELTLGKITDGAILDFWHHNRRMSKLRRMHCALRFAQLPVCCDCEIISLDVLRRKAELSAEYRTSASAPSERFLPE